MLIHSYNIREGGKIETGYMGILTDSNAKHIKAGSTIFILINTLDESLLYGHLQTQ
jgi:hypothetical protein